MKEIIYKQKNGGWGPDSRLTMWATNQSIAFLLRFKNGTLNRITVLDILQADYHLVGNRMLFSIMTIVLFIWLLHDDQNLIGFVISFTANLIFLIFPWMIKKNV